MTTIDWNGGAGDWSTAGSWSGGVAPNTVTANVTIAGNSSDVTVANSEDFTVGLLTLGSGLDAPLLSIAGLLDAGEFVLKSGTLDLSGTLAGATIVPTGGVINLASDATLYGVTYGGVVTASSGHELRLGGGFSGTIDVGDNANLDNESSMVINHALINLGSSTGGAVLEYDQSADGGTLTLGPSVTLDTTGANDQISNAGESGSAIINQGAINVGGYGLAINSNGGTFSNTGTIEAGPGGSVLDGIFNGFFNTGTIYTDGGTFGVSTYLASRNLGGVSLGSVGALEVFNNGTLDFGGGTLAPSLASNLIHGSGMVEDANGGTIANATIIAADVNLSLATDTNFYGVTYEGAATVATSQELRLEGGFSGTIDVGDNANLDNESSMVINHALINLGSSTGGAVLEYDQSADGGTLTLGPSVTLDTTGANDQISNAGESGSAIINQGAINVGGYGLAINSNGGTFSNTGTIEAGPGGSVLDGIFNGFFNTGTIYTDGGTFGVSTYLASRNLGGVSLGSVGALEVFNNGTLDFGGGTLAPSLASNLIHGSGMVEDANGGTIANATIIAADVNLSLATDTNFYGVTYEGAATVATSQELRLEGGFSGTIDVGDNANLDNESSMVINHALINLGSSTGGAVLEYDQSADGGTLTLGPSVTLDTTGANDQISNAGESGSAIINQGAINVGGYGLAINSNGGTFSNTGTIEAGPGGSVLDGIFNGFFNTGTIYTDGGTFGVSTYLASRNLGGVSLGSVGALEVFNNGTLDFGGGTLAPSLASNLIHGSGMVEDANGGTIANATIIAADVNLSLATDTNFYGVTYEGAATVATSQELRLEGGFSGTIDVGDNANLDNESSMVINHALINLGSSTGGAVLEYDQSADGGTLTLGPSVTLDTTGANDQISNAGESGSAIINQGVINAGGYGLAISANGGSFSNTGIINIGTGASVIDNIAPFINTGTINVEGGTFVVQQASTLSEFGDISLSGTGAIDLQYLGFTLGATATIGAGGVVTLSQGGSLATPTTLTGDAGLLLSVERDAAGGTEIVAKLPCFVAGTRIAAARGKIPVERLRVGDRVKTMHGGMREIIWIGTRAYDGRMIAGNHLAMPVRIRRHALGFNVPSRDLYVSPDHAICEGGVLIHAWRLVNGVSITQAARVETVTYFHIELAKHDIVFAENCPAESFLDDDARGRFQHAAGTPAAAQPPCLPRVSDGFYLERIRGRIAARAGIVAPAGIGPVRGFVDEAGPLVVRGWAQDVAHPEAPVCLDILADGQLMARVLANSYRPDLRAAGLGSGCHGFELTAPAGGVIEVRRSADGAALGRSAGARAA